MVASVTDILTLLEEIQSIARTGLNYAENPYDIERYEKLLSLAVNTYGEVLCISPDIVRQRFAAELGQITPKVGGDAAVFDDEGRLLLHLRVDDQTWCLPCGWVEPNEAPIDTAVRETLEETGLEVRPLELVGVFSRPASLQYGPHSLVKAVYLCEVIGGEIKVSHEGLDVKYLHLEDVPAWHANHRIYAEAAHKCWQARH